jgi:hypothetical protein
MMPPDRRRVGFFRGLHKCQSVKDASFFLLQAILAALFLIVGVALAIEAASGGYGIGLVIVVVMANRSGLVFFILAALSAATAMHLRPRSP